MLHPHGSCYLWNPWLTGINFAGDLAIALAYFAIPITITLQRRRLPAEWKPILFCVAMFILGCGVTHLFDAWNIWHVDYWPEGLSKSAVAVISCYTAWLLPRVLPKIVEDKFLLTRILATTPDGIVVLCPVWNRFGVIVDFVYQAENPAARQILGRSIAGRSMQEIFPDNNNFDKHLETLVQQKSHQYEVRHNERWFTVASVPLDGKVAALFRDITESKKEAHRDELTGLPNQRHVEKEVNAEEIVAYLFADLDRFKEVNDAYGHDVGDRVLIQVADRLAQVANRQENIPVRLGGDEFAILVRNGDAEEIAEEVVLQIEQPYQISDLQLHLSVSVGIAHASQESVEGGLTGMRSNADIAMYQGKANRDSDLRIYTYEQGMAIKISNDRRIEEGLRRAIARQEFVLYYQPIVKLSDLSIAGFEALIRWNHPDQGILPPSYFIEVAEKTGLIGRICDWVFIEAFRQGRIWSQQAGKTLKMGVNLSASDMERQNLLELIRLEILNRPGFAGVPFFEITETALGAEREILEFLVKVRGLGAGMGIDDFGTGYSTLYRLNRLKKLLSAIKIDRSFLEPENLILYEIIVKAAKVLKLEIISEGVETAEQLELLQSLGCDFGQGYFFYRPMPASEVDRLELVIRGSEALDN